MPVEYTEAGRTKLARAATGGGFESAIEAPEEPTGAPSISSVTDNGDGTLTIAGSNFGTKAQAAPVLHDFVSHAYENGTLNNYHQSLADGTDLSLPAYEVDAEERIYESIINTQDRSDDVVALNKSGPMRHAGSTAFYRMVGAHVGVGWPRAAGGKSPAPSTKLYVAYHCRRKWARHYMSMTPQNYSGEFIPGEDITYSGPTRSGVGRFIGTDLEGRAAVVLHFEFDTSSFGDLNDQVTTITGVTSAATTEFPALPYGAANNQGVAEWYETPGTKYMRFKDNENNQHLRGQVSDGDGFVLTDGNDYERFYDGLSSRETPDEYALHEHEIDIDPETETGVYRAYFNGELRGVCPFGSSSRDVTKGPMFQAIGNDAYQSFQVNDVDEIYCDNVLNRVYLGDASTKAACSHLEVQTPLIWVGNNIEVEKNTGTLTGTVWVYVAGPDGSVNQSGYEVQV